MTPETDKILRDLGVVGRIKTNERLMTQTDFFEIQCPTPWQSLRRSFYGETRQHNIGAITNCIRLAKSAITTILAERADSSSRERRGTVTTEVMLQEEMHTCVRMAQTLLNSVNGLRCLKTTYREDIALVVRIDELILDIKTFVRTIARSVGLPEIDNVDLDP